MSENTTYTNAKRIAKTATPHDKILFNDRKRPLTITRIRESDYNDIIKLEIEGPNGGRYRLTVDGEIGYATLERYTGDTEETEYDISIPKTEEIQFTEIEFAEKFKFEEGQVFRDTSELSTGGERFRIIKNVARDNDEMKVVTIRTDGDGGISATDERNSFSFHLKKLLFNDEIEQIYQFNKGRKYKDTETDEVVEVLGYGGTGLRLQYEDVTRYLPWSHFFPESDGRFLHDASVRNYAAECTTTGP